LMLKMLLQRESRPMIISIKPQAVIIVKIWNQLKCPSTDKWIQKMWYIYTTEYYSAIRMNEILPLAITWMELENIMLSKISQPQKDKSCMFLLICES
uniref:DUF1725 domain-containing protein n=1 Tax=Prolemur simus TaxID=1328070 RepID=A0A8C9DKP1_PROSS